MVKVKNAVLQSYLAWASLSFAFIVSIIIIIRNRQNKKQINILEKPSYKLPKYLRLWSSLLLYTTPFFILLFLSRKISYICLWVYPFTPAALIWPKVFLTFFEIARLKFCFASNKIPKELEYPNWLFVILYLIGYCLLIISPFYDFATTTIHKLDNNIGCTYDQNRVWSSITTTIVLTLAIWNWTIVLLYSYKLYQFKKKINGTDPATKLVIEKINLVLSKMLFLILIIQIIALFIALSNIWLDGFYQIGWMIDYILVVLIMYLMLIHNQKDYYRFIGFFIKIGCIKYCCCCIKGLIAEDVIHEINQKNRNEESGNETTNDVTGRHDGDREITENVDNDYMDKADPERTSIILMKYIDTETETKTIDITDDMDMVTEHDYYKQRSTHL